MRPSGSLIRREAYKESLRSDLSRLEALGCDDMIMENMRTRLACIEWMESHNDSRPLCSDALHEFSVSKEASESVGNV